MKKLIHLLILFVALALIVFVLLRAGKCRQRKDADKGVVVSILPLKCLTDRITGGSVAVDVLVPPGSSPETYEPTPAQMIALSTAKAVFTTGLLDFERSLMGKSDKSTENKIVDLSKNVDKIIGGCHYGHSHAHGHGIDPHIWTSPRELKVMAATMFEALSRVYPDSSHFAENYVVLVRDLDELDAGIKEIFANLNLKYFIIYHPALTYYSRDYNVAQLALEDEGKEPSAERMRSIVEKARMDGVKKILYQKEFSRSVVETVARDIGAEPVEIDPLAEDVIGNLLKITKIIATSHE